MALMLAGACASAGLSAQQPPAAEPATAQRFAPIDLTGTWVSIITEDWAVRMIPPPKGNVESLPLTPAARDAVNRADVAQLEAAGRACDAYGAPAILREPGRVRFTWQDPNTLRIDTDAGEQTRVLQFGNVPAGAPSRQGHSKAEWQYAGGFNPQRAADALARGGAAAGGRGGARGGGGGGGRGAAATAPRGGRLKVVTTNLTAGLLRKNGVPYSANTTLTEYFNLITEPNGTQWFVVTTVVHDPENLVVDYIMSSNFRKEADTTKWRPLPCSLR
jgi:hypothetical protein